MIFKYLIVISIALTVTLLDFTLVDAQTVERGALVSYATNQYRRLLSNLTVGRYISETSPLNLYWDTVGPSDWLAGYLPATLWNLYRYTGDSHWRQMATNFIDPLVSLTSATESYVVAFATAYDLTRNASYANILIRAADTIVSNKYNASLGLLIGFGRTESGIGMSDTFSLGELDCLVRAGNLTGNNTYNIIAETVLDSALRLFVRTNNYTTFSTALFNMTTGEVTEVYADSSPFRSWGWWSRGHMWFIVGLVDVYRVTATQRFLTAAENLAAVYIENLPNDYITYNEFYTANLTGYWVRDTTSASIAAAYFPELARYTANSTLRDRLLSTSTSILQSLWSAEYRADGKPVYRLPAFLANATHNIPIHQDYSFSIADYYFSKAIQYAASTSVRPYISLSLLFIMITAVDFIYYLQCSH